MAWEILTTFNFDTEFNLSLPTDAYEPYMDNNDNTQWFTSIDDVLSVKGTAINTSNRLSFATGYFENVSNYYTLFDANNRQICRAYLRPAFPNYLMILIDNERQYGKINVITAGTSYYGIFKETSGTNYNEIYECLIGGITPPITAPNLFIGDSTGVARQIQNAYIGVNGVAKKVNGIYIGDANGIARKI